MEIKGHKIVYKILVGSHAYGTNVEGSDEDIKGIFIQSPESVLEEGYLPQIEVSKDEVYFELGRFVDLVSGGNPTMLEMLYAPMDTIIYYDPIMLNLFAYAYKLLTKQLRLSFGGYAIDQIKKASGLDKKMNWEDERKIRKTVLDFCYITDMNYNDYTHPPEIPNGGDNPNESYPLKDWLNRWGLSQNMLGLSSLNNFRYGYNVFIDFDAEYDYKGVVSDEDKANDISLSSIPKGRDRDAVLYFNKDGYSVHCKEYNSYLTWLKERNEQRYIDVEGHGQRIDGKNMLHCVRLLDVATEIAQGKGLEVRRPNAEYLKSIRRGEVSLEEILKESQEKINNLDELFNQSGLPDKADKEFFKELVIKMRKQHREVQYQELVKKLEE